MHKQFLAHRSSLMCSTNTGVQQALSINEDYDALAIYSVIRSFQEETSGLEDDFYRHLDDTRAGLCLKIVCRMLDYSLQ